MPHRSERTSTCCPIASGAALHIKERAAQPAADDKSKFWLANNWWDPGYNLNENFWEARIMRQFTFIASSMRKVLTHLVFLWLCICSTITGRQQIGCSSGREKKSNLLAKMLTILSSQIIKAEWTCNCCLRKIISHWAAYKRLWIWPVGVWFIQ